MRVLLPLLLLAPLLTGCLADDGPSAADAPPVAQSAEEAGAASGPAPSAPKGAFVVAPDAEARSETVVAYPAAIRTNAAKPPVELDLSDAFEAGDCRGFNFGPTEDALSAASRPRHWTSLAEHLAVGDVFQYEIAFSVTNTDAAWGEIHPFFAIGSDIMSHDDSTREGGTVSLNWTGQGYRTSEDEAAWVMVACWYGTMTQPVPYTLTVKLTFADSAIPAQAPIRVPVPADATRLFVRGVAFDPQKGVSSHFRLFDAQDDLVCECGLSSAEEVATVAVKGGDELVLLVDHTDNGFVSLAFDAPPTEDLEAMQVEWLRTSLVTSTGGPVDATVDVDLPKVPLFMSARVLGPPDGTPGAGKKTQLSLVNGRGEVLRQTWGGHTAMQVQGDGGMWLGFWPADWERTVDHHAFAPGAHVATIKAEALRGEVVLYTRQYVR